ncbi:peptidase T [Gracilibacillus marinus]|uniref:Peptidase T n=1 Tax=Gracilibacillus marinus TaxID=630535 RepID=A0ABV8VYK1_9BACI
MKQQLIERLVRYAKINTQSDESSNECPSTKGQWDLANLLVEELKRIGMEDVTIDEHAYVMATLPSNISEDVPTIGFLAHVDTATDFTGDGVNPQIVTNYQGGPITLNEAKQIHLSPSEFPELSNYIGKTLITTDGTTLLGADNKAGVAEIMTAMHYLIENPHIPHGNIRVAFTPDEEIGRGPHLFDVERFQADFAYTIDGGPLGELQFESFNAAAAKITVKGNNVHPGTAKGKMIHALKIAIAIHDALPKDATPEATEGYEGFYHLLSLNGDVETAQLYYIIRDHDKEAFLEKKANLEQIVAKMQQQYGEKQIILEMKDQYYNMAEKINPVKHIVELASDAMEAVGITPDIKPIRGGTDGSQLSFMGLPTPNIFTGGENFHGKYEYVCVEHMEKAVQTITKIIELNARKQGDK